MEERDKRIKGKNHGSDNGNSLIQIERLKEAFEYFEEMRYQFIIARMKENGGCRVWDWKKPHIVAMLVKLGLEEPTVNEKTGTRRRRQKAAMRRHASPQVGAAAAAATAAAAGGPAHPAMGDWSGGLGLHHPIYAGHAHHMAAGTAARHGAPSYDAIVTEDFASPPQLTPKQEEDLISEVFRDVKPERDLSPDEGMDGLSYGPSGDAATGNSRPSSAATGGTAGTPAGVPRNELNHQHQHQQHRQGNPCMTRQICDQQLLQHPHPAPHPQMTENPYGPQQ